MKNKLLRALSYVLVAAAASALTLALYSGSGGGPSKLEQLEELIQARFIGEADAVDMEDAAADAMIRSLGDRWSYYIPAAEYQSHMEHQANAYVGIGITIQLREDGTGFDITKVEENGPAQEAGLRAGDIITAVDGEKVAALGADGAKERVRGKEGTYVDITVLRQGTELTLSVERRTIQTKVATGELLDGGIGLVTIVNFNSKCADETISAIESLLDQGAEKLIFDVRFNGGGYKAEMVKALDYLLPEGPLFRSVDYAGRERVDKSGESCLDIPMAVLVNGSSYSAAEFFAAALREYDAAVVVGEKTSGKGHFQNTFTLLDGSAVGLSVGKYFTPQGVSLEGVGITPDVLVEVDAETAAMIYAGTLPRGEDPQLQAAVAALSEESWGNSE